MILNSLTGSDQIDGAAVLALIWIAKELVAFVVKKRSNGNGYSNGHGKSSCCVEQLEYWDRVENRVTKPIVQALNEVKLALRE
jgi:hypothetical protein